MNDGKSSRNCSRKCVRSITEAPRLGFSSRKHVFSPKTVEMHSIGVRNPLPPSSPRRAGDFLRKLPEAPPFLLSSPLIFVIYRKVTEALRKHIGLDFLLFSFPSHPSLVKYAYLGLWEFYRSITEVPKALEAIFHQNGGGGYHPARPGELGCFLLKQPSFQNVLEGPRFKNSIYTPI